MVIMATGLQRNPPVKVNEQQQIKWYTKCKCAHLQISVQKFTLFTFYNVSTAPAPVAAVTVGVATGATALLSGVFMALWLLKKMKKKADAYELSR